MAKLKDDIEGKLIQTQVIQKLFPEGVDFDENKSKFLKVSVKKDKEGDAYDVFIVTIRIRSDEPISESIHVNALMNEFFKLEDKVTIRKVALNNVEIVSSDFSLYNYADVQFIVISDAEKVKE